MTDLETFLKTHLNEQIDAELGARRPAPPFRPPQREQRPWLRPLLAAACVLAVAAAAVALARLESGRSHRAPAAHSSGPQPTHTNSPQPSAQTRIVRLGAARVVLPANWTAVPAARWLQPGTVNAFGPADWCLQAKVAPVRRDGKCALEFIPVTRTRNQFVPSRQDASNGDAGQYCAPHVQIHLGLQTAIRSFGGRTASWRQWRYTCQGAPNHVVEQYVVATGPAYVLVSNDATGNRRRVMRIVAQHSTLPEQTSTLPIGDSGKVTAVAKRGDRVRVTIRRTDLSTGSARDFTYPMSRQTYRHGGSPKAGTFVYVDTDGSVVTAISTA